MISDIVQSSKDYFNGTPHQGSGMDYCTGPQAKLKDKLRDLTRTYRDDQGNPRQTRFHQLSSVQQQELLKLFFDCYDNKDHIDVLLDSTMAEKLVPLIGQYFSNPQSDEIAKKIVDVVIGEMTGFLLPHLQDKYSTALAVVDFDKATYAIDRRELRRELSQETKRHVYSANVVKNIFGNRQ